jgi:hypothetical protein
LPELVQETAHEPLVHQDGHLRVAQRGQASLLCVTLAKLHTEVLRHAFKSLFELGSRPVPHVLAAARMVKPLDGAAYHHASGVCRAAIHHLEDLCTPCPSSQVLQVEAVWCLSAAKADSDWLLSHAQKSQRSIAFLQIGLGSWSPDDLTTPMMPDAR